MSDYISRKAVIELLHYNADERCSAVVSDFEAIPAADVERQGRWERYTHSRYCGIDADGEPVYRDGVVYYCSNPKCRRKTVIKENYCPNCGAKMDLEEEAIDG